VATDTRNYLHYFKLMPAPEQDSVFPFVCKELHLIGYRLPVQLMKVKYCQ
jgi:hypothetical protein